MLVDLANCAAADGHSVHVCVTRSETPLARDLHPHVHLTVLGRKKRFDWPAMKRFIRLIQEVQPEILHLHGRSTFAFLTLLRMVYLVRRPLVFHDHRSPPAQDTPSGQVRGASPLPLWFRLFARRAAAYYVAVHPGLRPGAERAGISAHRIRVIGNCLDLARLRVQEPTDLHRELDVPSGTRLGLVVAGLRPCKGIHLLIEAVACCESSGPWCIVVAGGTRDAAYVAECRARIQELGLEGRIRLLGERQDVVRLMQGVDFGVIPSLSESGPLVLIEYLAHGLPVVYTRTGEVAQRALAHGLPGGASPGDVKGLAQELDRILSSSEEALRERADQARTLADRYFDLRRVMPEWYAVYAEALKGVAA